MGLWDCLVPGVQQQGGGGTGADILYACPPSSAEGSPPPGALAAAFPFLGTRAGEEAWSRPAAVCPVAKAHCNEKGWLRDTLTHGAVVWRPGAVPMSACPRALVPPTSPGALSWLGVLLPKSS